jgi:hypothetical protein
MIVGLIAGLETSARFQAMKLKSEKCERDLATRNLLWYLPYTLIYYQPTFHSGMYPHSYVSLRACLLLLFFLLLLLRGMPVADITDFEASSPVK